MASVVVFHSVLGVRQGEMDAAERLRSAGHHVIVPDLYGGRRFDDYDLAMTFSHDLGNDTINRRALESVADLPDGFITAGFSMGSGVAVYVATQRQVRGVVQFAGLNVLEWYGPEVRWPTGIDSQSHQTVDDPWREDEFAEQAIRDVTSAGGTIEVFVYPGSGHLFTDPTLPDEYDAAATELLWTRVLPFVAAR